MNVRFLLQGSGPNSIDTSGSSSQTISNGINSINRIQFTICSLLPVSFFGTITSLLVCNNIVILTFIGAGSLDINTVIAGGSFSSSTEASNVISNTFASGTSMDGLSVLSTTTTSEGYSTSSPSSSSTNLGLILGLSIPLVLLRNIGYI